MSAATCRRTDHDETVLGRGGSFGDLGPYSPLPSVAAALARGRGRKRRRYGCCVETMGSGGGPSYFLGSIGTGVEPRLTFAHEISAAEHEALNDGLGRLHLRTPFTYRLVERNYISLEDAYRFAVMLLTSGTRTRPDRMALIEAIMSSIVNWLTAVRLFLDHEETWVKRRFGAASPEANRYLQATHEAYDNRRGYRFAYRFRNFVQHCGMPIGSVTVELVDADTPDERSRALFLLNRNHLLSTFDAWGRHVQADLEAGAEMFEFFPLTLDAMEGVRDVYRVLLDIRLDDALAAAPTIAAGIERLASLPDDEAPALFRVVALSDGSQNVTPRMIDPALVEALAEVAAGRRERSTLFVSSDAQTHTRPLAPEEIARAVSPQSKGLEVIAMFFAEHGATDRFHAHMNELLNDEDTFPSLVGGLVDAGVVLASMVATLLGTEPGGLVTGLRSMYLDSETI